MSTEKPRSLLRIDYAEAAEAYLRSLPPEHFMEATPQSIQRVITSESLDLVRTERPEIQYFNELLVQYPYGRAARIKQVVPDTMVVVHAEPIDAVGSYDLPLQPVRPFWVLEYVSKSSKRKDYEDNFRKYELELKVPYYLLFFPDGLELTLYRRGRSKYVAVHPNAAGRLAIDPLQLEMAIADGWVRFWFGGELLPLPAEHKRQLQSANAQKQQAQDEARQWQAEAQRERQETERLRARLRELGIEP